MSIIANPNVVSDLVFEYDMSNTRSWKGMPTTNQFPTPTPSLVDNSVVFPVQGTGTFYRVYSGTYGGYTITNNDVVYRYDLGLTGCHFHGINAPIAAGAIPTFTFDYYISPDAANFPTVNYLANIEPASGGAQGNSAACPNSTKGIWQTISFSTAATTAGGGTQNYLLYPGACSNSYLASSGYILYKNPQVIHTTGQSNSQVPFVGPTGTRSNTKALLDLSGLNNLTCTSLTYETDNTFSFNGTSDYLDAGSVSSYLGSNITVCTFAKISSVVSKNNLLSLNNAYNFFLPGNRLTTTYMLYWDSASGWKNGNTSTWSTNQWYQLCWTISGTALTFYVNGVADGSTTLAGNIAPSGATRIGLANTGEYATGSIGAVQIYSRALSANEIAQNFNAYRSRYNI